MKNSLLLAILMPLVLQAQKEINVNDTIMRNNITYNTIYGGIPVINPKYVKVVEGSVFFPENFTTALLFVKDNRRPYALDARLNIMEGKLHYLDEKNIEMQAESDIEEIHFIENGVVSAVYTLQIPDCAEKNSGCFEVMERGKASLYRKVAKRINEFKPYGSATTEQKVHTSYQYWIQTDKSCSPLKNIQELQSVLLQSDPSFRQRLPARRWSDKEARDWTEIVKLYNK